MKRALITGASRGIGRAIAESLAGEEFHLILQGRDKNALTETMLAVGQNRGTAEIHLADLSDSQAITALTQSLKHQNKTLDILVHNAGITCVKPVQEIDLEEWQKMLAVNVTAPFLLTRDLLPLMTKGASIVNILSIAARTGFPGWSAYCMSKFALAGFSQSLREELRSSGIRVIDIYPSATDTDIWNQVSGEWPREKMMPPSEVAEAVRYAVTRPGPVLVENITVGGIAGTL